MLKIFVDKISLTQLTDARRNLVLIKNALLNRRKPLRAIKKYMVGQWNTNFDDEGGMYGNWPALSEKWTVPEREALGYGGRSPKLRRTNTMRGHFRALNQAGVVEQQALEWNFFSVTDAWVLTHHFGMRNPLAGVNDIPARPLWGINFDDEEYMVDELENYVDEVVARYYA